MFTALISSGHFLNDNPVQGLKGMKVNEREMGYLSKSECVQLLDALAENPDERLAVEILLSTGARWGEVAALEQRRVLHCRITFSKTKNSKTVPFLFLKACLKRSKTGRETGVSDAGLSIGSRCHQNGRT